MNVENDFYFYAQSDVVVSVPRFIIIFSSPSPSLSLLVCLTMKSTVITVQQRLLIRESAHH